MSNGMQTYYKPGSWNAICDRCGKIFKAEELQLDWQGLMLCAKDWEPRHPQDFVRGVPDNMTPPWQRVGAAPQFVNVPTYVQPPVGGGGGPGSTPGGSVSDNHSAVAGIAVAGNAIPSRTF
jgi:hypothetical protein